MVQTGKFQNNDPLDIKNQGFPSVLPTSDFGTLFSK